MTAEHSEMTCASQAFALAKVTTPLPGHGIYIVKSGNSAVKVAY